MPDTTLTTQRGLPVRPPSTRAEIVGELTRLAAEVERIAAAFDTTTFFAPQHEDGSARWSPAQQVRHLTRATFPLARAFRMPRVALLLRFGMTFRRPDSYAGLVRRYEHVLASRPSAGASRHPPTTSHPTSAARRSSRVSATRSRTSSPASRPGPNARSIDTACRTRCSVRSARARCSGSPSSTPRTTAGRCPDAPARVPDRSPER